MFLPSFMWLCGLLVSVVSFLFPRRRLQMNCCGWSGHLDWNGNMVIVNSSQLLFPCSCQNISVATGNSYDSGFCEAQTPDWPVYDVVNCVSCSCARVRALCRTAALTRCRLSAGLRCQRGELAAHQHRRGPGNLPGSGSDRGNAPRSRYTTCSPSQTQIRPRSDPYQTQPNSDQTQIRPSQTQIRPRSDPVTNVSLLSRVLLTQNKSFIKIHFCVTSMCETDPDPDQIQICRGSLPDFKPCWYIGVTSRNKHFLT